MTRQIIDALTDEVTIVDLSEEELAELETLAIESEERKEAIKAQEIKKAEILEKLGLSEEELAAVLG
jgi:DNA-binding transcriptional regulator YiaG